MKDTVYREDAIANIKLLYEDPEVDEHDKIWNNAIFAAENEIRRHTASAPSAQPERKKGKWILKNAFANRYTARVNEYMCSECGRTVCDDNGYDVAMDYPFCHCGADMRGEGKA